MCLLHRTKKIRINCKECTTAIWLSTPILQDPTPNRGGRVISLDMKLGSLLFDEFI